MCISKQNNSIWKAYSLFEFNYMVAFKRPNYRWDKMKEKKDHRGLIVREGYKDIEAIGSPLYDTVINKFHYAIAQIYKMH